MNIRSNITALLKDLPDTCRLIAVSKTQPVEKVLEAYNAGHRSFGENKVQELVPKYEALPKDIEWHMIGHLQSNKVKYIAPFVHLIHSVDSVKLLEEIDKQGRKVQRIIPCLLQVHIAREETKFGFSEEEISQLASSAQLAQWHNVKIMGLMGMATFTDDTGQVRSEFRTLRSIFEKLKATTLPAQFQLEVLSMGMSGDYKIAVEEGSTMVRVGSAIFGERNKL
ncbi:YggS family pyridoxal phosphate-dependent enzyme [Fulvivirgaceae bacterium PWU4]|uniref:Pyridoxal phosphate homeostasis protein n=1 Tax=Chryseosolibacter histidini TaxID=2782349 RepID=A0AAP2GT21_9BACT|nr:YggS family pyridoxal phosphate-dependent enzyme [Chryseosolibacter histidini]MBT1701227.1 YggS family pyridoxal phosphate-dependent enzyme [Chryseosolibacter histidini]